MLLLHAKLFQMETTEMQRLQAQGIFILDFDTWHVSLYCMTFCVAKN